MPISVTCQCGARLEIDEKFLGKEIPCPDCNRPLPTTPPPKPPPLELPDNRRVSALAVLSLTLAIVGPPILGTLAAVGVGIFALREIRLRPAKFEGVNIARAGIVTGAIMTFLWLAMLVSPTALGLDSFLREFKYAARRQFPKTKLIEVQGLNDAIEIDRPGLRWERWATYISNNQNASVSTDDLILINTIDNAYIACQRDFVAGGDNAEEKKNKALARFKKSELVHVLNGGPLERDWKEVEPKDAVPGIAQDVLLDVRLGGIERRVLIQFTTTHTRLDILVGVARRGDFERLEPDFREAFKSRKFRQ